MWQPDGAGTRARIGVIVPHLDLVPESELAAMAPDGVSVHGARVPLGMIGPDGEIIAKVGPAVIKAFADPPAVDDAVSLLADAGVDVIIYGFTSSSYTLGRGGEEALKARLEARSRGIPLVISAQAAAAALRAVAAGRIALIHPPWFSDEADRLGRDYFTAQGFEVFYHGVADFGRQAVEFAPKEVHDWVLAQVPRGVDAVFFGGNGFRVIGAIAALEAALGRPVLSANQVVLWSALKAAGLDPAIPGYGRLLQGPQGPQGAA